MRFLPQALLVLPGDVQCEREIEYHLIMVVRTRGSTCRAQENCALEPLCIQLSLPTVPPRSHHASFDIELRLFSSEEPFQNASQANCSYAGVL